jgi:hypothetical protein
MDITNDLTVGGNLTVNGMTTVINTDILEVKDNIIEINSDEVGPGVTTPQGLSGIQVNRGGLTSYQFVFRETDDSFCIGQVSDLQTVATREDSPLNRGLIIFNSTLNRLDSVTTVPLSTTFSSSEQSTSSSTGTLRVQGGLGVTGNIYTDSRIYIKGSDYSNYIRTSVGQDLIINSSSGINLDVSTNVKLPASKPIIFSTSSHYISGNGSSLTMESSGPVNILSGSGSSVNLRANTSLNFGAITEKITYDGTNMVLDASNIFVVNSITSFTNSNQSSSSSSGSVKLSGGLGISNVTDASSSVNGGSLTTAGGVGITKKLFVGGVGTFENTSDTSSLVVSGGVTVNKKLLVGSNYSGNPVSEDGIFLQSPGYTFTDNVTSNSGSVNSVNFNFMGINSLAATNAGIITNNSSTLYIEGAPVSGTNQTISNRYSLYINEGISRFNGDVTIRSTNASTSLSIDGGATINKNLIVNSKFDVGANITSPPSSSGVFLSFSPRTVTDNVTLSGTVAEMLFNVIGQPSLASSNSITTTNAATFVINGAPLQSTNQTITNSYSAWIKSGTFRLDADFKTSGVSTLTNTTESSSTITGSLISSGGMGIAKNLYVGGITVLESTAESSSINNAGTVVKGGMSVVKNTIIGQTLETGYSNFSSSSGLGKMFKTGGNEFTDSSTTASGTQSVFSTSEFKQTTLKALNTSVTTTDASTVYIAGPVVAGANQTITNNRALHVETGNTKLGGNLEVTGSINSSANLTLQGTLDVNGQSFLDQVTIVTDDGQFSVSGTNPVDINVSNNCNIRNTSGNIVIDSQAGVLTLDGNNSLNLDSTGSISIDAGASSNFNTTVGTLSLGGPIVGITSTTTNINSTSAVNIATGNSGAVVTIGHTTSETIVNDNLTVTGDFTVRGNTAILATDIITTKDNAIIVNSMPAGMSDGGLLIRRYQTPNNSSLGQVIQDTPYETGAFQSSLILDVTASVVTDYYKGWWLKVTSGAASGYVRRIKSSNSSRQIVIYTTTDNNIDFADGLDLGATINTGDTYELFPGTYAGIFFNDTANEISIGNVSFDAGAGVFPLHGYLPFHVKTLIVDTGLSLVGETLIEGLITVDNNDSQCILVRKNGDTGDVFYVNSIDPSINLANPVNTIGTSSLIRLLANNSSNSEVLYSQISSTIKDNTTGSVDGELALGVVRNSTLENYITLNALNQLTTISSLTNITNNTSSNSTSAALKVTGGITASTSTDATGVSSGGGLTVLGGAGITKKLFVGSDAYFNSSATGTGTVKIGPSSSNGESSISFYGDTSYSGQLWAVGHGVSGTSTNSFGIYNSNTSSLSLSINTSGVVNIPTSVASSSSSTGSLVVTGGVGISLDLNVGGNVSGTWNGNTISVSKGGTGATSFTSNGVLVGNGTSAISPGSGITYASNTLTIPKLVSNDTTDSTSITTGAIQIAGGVGISKKLFVGTDATIGGNVYLSGEDSILSHTTVDGSDTGSISIASGGSSSSTRGSTILLKANDHATQAGKISLTCGNVNNTGSFSVITSDVERFSIGYSGVVTISNALDASSSTAGALVLSGGLAVAKKTYIGSDLSVSGNSSLSTISSGTWNGSTISVLYGGTGATSLTANAILIGNGTGAIQATTGITFSSNTLSVNKIASLDTTQSTSSSSGAVTILGGLGVAKNVHLGEDLVVTGRIGAGTSTNINSAITLASGSNIGINTVVSFDTGSLSISGSGVGLVSRGAVVNMYGIDHSTLPGNLVLNSGTSSGIVSINTANTPRITVDNSGITTFLNTSGSTSGTTGSVVLSGGLSISKSTNASSSTNGGSLTVAGGAAIAQDLHIGGNLIMTGTIPGAMTVTEPSVTASNLVNLTTAVPQNTKLRKVALNRTFTCAFVITPSAVRSQCTFEFTLPEVVTNLTNSYDVICSINGYLADFTPVENTTVYGLSGTTKAKVRFTSGPSTADHIIQLTLNYTIV